MTTQSVGDPLRAGTWDTFIGQTDLKERLRVHISAARQGRRMLDHILLTGPPGFGKTTLAQIIAQEVGDPFESLTLPIKATAFAQFLRVWPGGVLLLDEIHRASAAQQEDLLTLLQDGYLQTSNGRRINIPALTVIGATTEPDKVIPPLWDRFPIKPSFEEYSDADMGRIVLGMAHKIGLTIDTLNAEALGRATGGIPRNARSLVLAARDIAVSDPDWIADDVLDLCGVEPDGLTDQHLAYLHTLHRMGKPTGLTTLASLLRLPGSIVQELERLLLKLNLIEYTASGRDLTSEGTRRVRPTVGVSRVA